MLVGAHVSPAGGLSRAIERGSALGARVDPDLQPVAARCGGRPPTARRTSPRSARRWRASAIGAVLIHAVYLLNCASDDPEIRAKSLASLTQSLRVGDGDRRARRRRCTRARPRPAPSDAAIARAGERVREALAETERCPLHLENTAGAGGTLGRSFERARGAAGGRRRRRAARACAWTPATCSPPATTSAPPPALDARARRGRARRSARGRLGSLHLNDSQTPLGSNRDRHAEHRRGRARRRRAARVPRTSRASSSCPACSRRPARTARGRPRRRWHACALRKRGLRSTRRAPRAAYRASLSSARSHSTARVAARAPAAAPRAAPSSVLHAVAVSKAQPAGALTGAHVEHDLRLARELLERMLESSSAPGEAPAATLRRTGQRRLAAAASLARACARALDLLLARRETLDALRRPRTSCPPPCGRRGPSRARSNRPRGASCFSRAPSRTR